MKATLTTESVNSYIDLHKQLGLPFTIAISNYTTRLTSLAYDIHFLKSVQSKKAFASFAMLRKEVVLKPVPKITIENLSYCNIKPRHENLFADKIMNVDIKAAYATVLLTDGFISRKTYAYILKLPKQERLTAVGMLAGRKNIYRHDRKGKVISCETVISPTSDYFFYCVKRISEIINDAAYFMEDDFLFSWVDGLYFLPGKNDNIKGKVKIIQDFFKERGFKTTYTELINFEIQPRKGYYHCRYYKAEKPDGLIYINVPKPENITLKKITAHLLNKDYF
jgi:hypothetical protein